jgi:Protein HRI1
MTLPQEFIAAWARGELIVDGKPVEGAGRAVWVEAGTAYVDVRNGEGFASGTTFAGLASWDEPHLTWAHAIDAESDGGADVGLMSYDGDDLIEEGEYFDDRVVRYSERWVRLAGSDGAVLTASADGGLAVRVGDHASVIVTRAADGGGVAARYDCWDGSAWRTEIEYGAAAERSLLPPPLEPGAELPGGWTWT